MSNDMLLHAFVTTARMFEEHYYDEDRAKLAIKGFRKLAQTSYENEDMYEVAICNGLALATAFGL